MKKQVILILAVLIVLKFISACASYANMQIDHRIQSSVIEFLVRLRESN